jgi:uncharacterized membrane protein (UPF0136 family)
MSPSPSNSLFAELLTDLSLVGYLLKNNKDYGSELALANSVLLTGSAVPRIIKTGARAPVPLALGAVGGLATYYYQKKYREFTYGV